MSVQPTFHWAVNRINGVVTPVVERGADDWLIPGRLRTYAKSEIEEVYEIVGEAKPPYGAVDAVRAGHRVPK